MPARVNREFLTRVGMTGLIVGSGRTRVFAQAPSPYSDWIPPSTKRIATINASA